MTYSPTNLFTGSTIPAAIGHAQCGKVTPRGSRLAGIVKFESEVRRWRQQLVTHSIAESDAAWGATGSPAKSGGLRKKFSQSKEEKLDIRNSS